MTHTVANYHYSSTCSQLSSAGYSNEAPRLSIKSETNEWSINGFKVDSPPARVIRDWQDIKHDVPKLIPYTPCSTVLLEKLIVSHLDN